MIIKCTSYEVDHVCMRILIKCRSREVWSCFLRWNIIQFDMSNRSNFTPSLLTSNVKPLSFVLGVYIDSFTTKCFGMHHAIQKLPQVPYIYELPFMYTHTHTHYIYHDTENRSILKIAMLTNLLKINFIDIKVYTTQYYSKHI